MGTSAFFLLTIMTRPIFNRVNIDNNQDVQKQQNVSAQIEHSYYCLILCGKSNEFRIRSKYFYQVKVKKKLCCSCRIIILYINNTTQNTLSKRSEWPQHRTLSTGWDDGVKKLTILRNVSQRVTTRIKTSAKPDSDIYQVIKRDG